MYGRSVAPKALPTHVTDRVFSHGFIRQLVQESKQFGEKKKAALETDPLGHFNGRR